MIFLLTSCGNPVLFLTSYRIVCCSHHYQPQLLSASLSPSLMLWFLFSPMDSPLRHLGVQTWTELVHPNLASSTLKNPDPSWNSNRWRWHRQAETPGQILPRDTSFNWIFFRNNHNTNQRPQPHCLWLDQSEISPQQRTKLKVAQVFQY